MAMAVLDAASDSIGVDTEEDARRVEEILRKTERRERQRAVAEV
jgi:GTP:adenosylcobinamide-phosphate guanylyltransferase